MRLTLWRRVHSTADPPAGIEIRQATNAPAPSRRPFEATLKTAVVRFQAHKFPGTQHGFNNDTTPRFDEAAAQQAWSSTLATFNRTLRT